MGAASAKALRKEGKTFLEIADTLGVTAQQARTLVEEGLERVAANVAMNEWGLDTLRRLARGLFGETDRIPLSHSGSGLPRGISPNYGKNGTTFEVRIKDPLFGGLRQVGSYKTLSAAIMALKGARSDSAVD